MHSPENAKLVLIDVLYLSATIVIDYDSFVVIHTYIIIREKRVLSKQVAIVVK